MPTDGYCLAIPLAELRSAAARAACQCGECHDDSERQRCADAAVRAGVCPCLLQESSVMKALATSFRDWIGADATRFHANGTTSDQPRVRVYGRSYE